MDTMFGRVYLSNGGPDRQGMLRYRERSIGQRTNSKHYLQSLTIFNLEIYNTVQIELENMRMVILFNF